MRNVIQKLLAIPFSTRQHQLARTRTPLTQAQFVQDIVEHGGDGVAAGLIWGELKEWTHADGFSPYPTDSLGSVFGIAEEELDEDLILRILREVGAPPPDQTLVSEFGPVDTPLAVAKLIAQCVKQPVAGGRNQQ